MTLSSSFIKEERCNRIFNYDIKSGHECVRVYRNRKSTLLENSRDYVPLAYPRPR